MTKTQYKKHTEAFFKGKEAVTKQDIHNRGGEFIPKGSVIKISGKRSGFQVKFGDVYITRVSPEKIEFDFEKYKDAIPCQ